MEKQSRRPDWGGGSVLLSDGALYGALGQGQIILVHIYRVLEGGCAGPQMEGWAGGSIAGESAHRAAVLGDDKLHPGILEGGAELSDLLALKVLQSLRRARRGIVDMTARSFR